MEKEYVDYFIMLLENGIRYNKFSSLEEMKSIANEKGLDINVWKKEHDIVPKLEIKKPKKRKKK